MRDRAELVFTGLDGPVGLCCPACGRAIGPGEGFLCAWDGAFFHTACAYDGVTDADAVDFAEAMEPAAFFALLRSFASGGLSLDDALGEWKNERLADIAAWKLS